MLENAAIEWKHLKFLTKKLNGSGAAWFKYKDEGMILQPLFYPLNFVFKELAWFIAKPSQNLN